MVEKRSTAELLVHPSSLPTQESAWLVQSL
jgi:hypothetical protein